MHYTEAVELNRKLETIQTSFTLNKKNFISGEFCNYFSVLDTENKSSEVKQNSILKRERERFPKMISKELGKSFTIAQKSVLLRIYSKTETGESAGSIITHQTPSYILLYASADSK